MGRRSIEAQIALLRAAMQWRVGRQLHYWLLAGGGILAILGVATGNPIALLVAAFLSLVGMAERRAAPNIVKAVEAYDTSEPSSGEVAITVTRWDSGDHYHARVLEQGQSDWDYEFIPHGWSPVTGRHAARIWRSKVNGSPALVVVNEGILIPRHDPKQAGPTR